MWLSGKIIFLIILGSVGNIPLPPCAKIESVIISSHCEANDFLMVFYVTFLHLTVCIG